MLAARPDSAEYVSPGGTGTDDPVAVITDVDALACLLIFKVLQQLNATCIFWIMFEAALPLAREPVWKLPRGV